MSKMQDHSVGQAGADVKMHNVDPTPAAQDLHRAGYRIGSGHIAREGRGQTAFGGDQSDGLLGCFKGPIHHQNAAAFARVKQRRGLAIAIAGRAACDRNIDAVRLSAIARSQSARSN